MSVFSDEFEEYSTGRKAPIRGIKDQALARKLSRYKRNVAKRYRVAFNDNIQRNLPSGPLWISKKIDGELWYAVKKDGEVALCAHNGRVVQGIPVVDEAEKLLADTGDAIIAGELFALPDEKDQRPRVHHVARALSDGDRAKTLAFRAFDIVELDGEDWQSKEYELRLEKMEALLNGKRVAVATTIKGEAGDALKCYNDWVLKDGMEGVVVRSEHGFTFKIKPTFTIDAVVLAFGERTISNATQIRELTVGLRREDGSFHILGTVGNGWKEVERLQWHEKLAELVVPSSFRMANREGTLCRFVRPEVVIEIKCYDLVVSDASDEPVRRMTLSYDEEEGYAATGPLPLASMLYPIFLREREDKTTDIGDIGLDQIYRHVPFDDRDSEPDTIDLPTSEIVSRRVFTKESKGNVMVRKFVALETNKTETDSRYPPFVVHFTDYSPTRKSPLKTSLRVAGSRETLQTHIDAWLEKNMKRGWNEVGAEELEPA